MKKVGLLGGTFDPPHIGHFIIAQEVKYQLELEEIWFIPTNDPPHKDKPFFSSYQRLQMIKEATKPMNSFYVKDIEIRRNGKSYTIDTVKQLQTTYPENDYYFIIGADMVEYLPKWKQIEELLERVSFVGVGRPEYTLETNYPIIKADIPRIDISSTFLREQLCKK